VPFIYDASEAQVAASIACGVALIVLSLRRGRIVARYGGWERYAV
jgi:hypothetical protein